MQEKAEVFLKSLALTNLIMMMLGGYLFARYPFNSITTVYSPFVIFLSLFIFFIDLYYVFRFLHFTKSTYQSAFSGKWTVLFWTYIVISFLTRIIFVATSSHLIAPIRFEIIFAFLSSICFAFLLVNVRGLPIAVHVKGRILVLVTLNFLTAVWLIYPFIGISFQGIPVGYIAIFSVGGLFKWLSYLVGAIVFYSWSNRMPSILSEQHKQELYPDEVEEEVADPGWPTY